MNNKSILYNLVTVICVIVFSLLLLVSETRSQTCVSPDTLPLPHFPSAASISGATVYYHYENIPDGEEKNQIEAAIINWNNALSISCSDVQFVYGNPVGAAPFITIKNGSLPITKAGNTDYDIVYGNETQAATITINPNVTGSTGIPYFNPNAPGYSTAYEKIAMHELGHVWD